MDKELVLATVNAAGGNDTFQVQPGDNAVEILREQGDLRIALTIPYQVHELFFEVEDRATGRKIKDWFDYYSETEGTDFKADLQRFLFVMRECDLRIDERGKSVEYCDQGLWRYFFGCLSAKHSPTE